MTPKPPKNLQRQSWSATSTGCFEI